ncbi:MAG: hypothetical protein AMXMBFR56_77110 [Polyangiaceae bacterium]
MGVRNLARAMRRAPGGRFGGVKHEIAKALAVSLKRARRHERGEYKTHDLDDETSDFVIAFDAEMAELDRYLDATGDAQ